MEKFIHKMVREAGELAMSYRAEVKTIKVEQKGSEKDLVSEADKAIERFIREKIEKAYPGHGVTGEEEGVRGDHDYRWIVDPIDGTVAFLHGQYFFSISVALTFKDELLMAAVYAPVLDDFFFAEKGKGAYLNGKPIHVSTAASLVESIFSTGFACVRNTEDQESLEQFCRFLPYVRDVRRYGSAALDLCYVACGQLDGYWERGLNLYDVAAGMLILTESGGKYSDYSGGNSGLPSEILATNGGIHQDAVDILSRKI